MARSMNDKKIPLVYELAEKFRKLAPWKWMYESDMFAVEHPETKNLHFVSIMGQLGQHLAIAVYPNPRAAYDIFDMSTSEEDSSNPTSVLEIPQCQLSFEKKTEFDSIEFELLLKTCPSYKTKRILPSFKTYKPARVPWPTDTKDLSMMAIVLEQALQVVPRFKKDGAEQLFDLIKKEEFLCRYFDDSTQTWTEEVRHIDRPEKVQPVGFVKPKLAATLSALKASHSQLIVDATMFMLPTDDGDGDVPVFPYMLLMIDTESGALVGHEVMNPIPDVDSMMARLPERVFELIIKTGQKPSQVLCCSQAVLQILTQPLKLVGIEPILIEQPEFIVQMHEEMMGAFDSMDPF